jgi:hypothetical protein
MRTACGTPHRSTAFRSISFASAAVGAATSPRANGLMGRQVLAIGLVGRDAVGSVSGSVAVGEEDDGAGGQAGYL